MPAIGVTGISSANANILPKDNGYPKINVAKFSSKRCWGLELEFGNRISGSQISTAIRKVDPEREIKVSQRYYQDVDNAHWHVKLDHSCGDIEGDYGWELASFKGSGIKDIMLMSSVAKSIKEAGVNVNNRCALHVHTEIADFSPAQLAVMCAIWIKIEPFICHIVPANRAESKYCKFFRHEKWVADTIEGKQKISPEFIWSKVKPTKNDNNNRRKSMNICNFVFTERKTTEFRFPESTVSDYDVRNWIKFFISFVETCRTAEMPSNLNTCTFLDFLNCCGFYGRNPFLLLSSGMRETKIWLLNRAIKFSRSPQVTARAKENLKIICHMDEAEGDCGS